MKDSLAGVEILEIGVLTPGKFAGHLMVGWGARSLRVERPVSEVAAISDEDLLLNRGKRSITVDLRAEAGRALVHRLATRADVVIEGSRPGAAERLGIGWDDLHTLNEKLVYCSISGFGQDGPDRLRPGYDLIFQAATGMLQATAPREAAPGLPTTFAADAATGFAAAFAISAALRKAAVQGEGSYIDLAMQDVAVSMLAVSHGTLRADGVHNRPPPSAAYNVYPAADGRHIAIGAARPASRQALFEHLGRPDLAERGMVPGDEEVVAFVRQALAVKPAAQWVSELGALDIEASLVRTPAEAFDDPQLAARGMVAGEEALRQINALGAAADPALAPAPAIGRDTDEILAELGHDAGDIAALREQGTV